MDDDELQDDQLDTDGDNEGADSGSDNSAPPENEPAAQAESKRVNDLMSKWQSAQAENARLKAQLAASGKGPGEDAQESGTNDRINEFEEFARDNARITLFNSDPRLAQNDLKPEDITGSTLAEMRASFSKHQKLIAGMEGRMRNRILAEHGLDPDVATGASTEAVPSFSKMTDKQFADFMAARDGRPR